MARVTPTSTIAKQKKRRVKKSFDAWELYQKLLSNNYLFHVEMFLELRLLLRSFRGKPFSMLDLACGDGSFMAEALADMKVSRYQGVDPSEVALRHARRNLRLLRCPKRFVRSDLLAFLRTCKGPCDLAVSAYSFHLLPQASQKSAFFEACGRLLRPKGRLVIIDLARREAETREQYLARWWDYARRECELLTFADYQHIMERMSESAFPESFESCRRLALKNGFRAADSTYADPEELHRFMSFAL